VLVVPFLIKPQHLPAGTSSWPPATAIGADDYDGPATAAESIIRDLRRSLNGGNPERWLARLGPEVRQRDRS
jgi:hypothetical protein